MPNKLFTLSAFFKDGLWMFNDPRRDIYEEPFIAGADIMFDVMSKRIDRPEINFCFILFANAPLPTCDVHAKHLKPDGYGGHVYCVKQFTDQLIGFEFWLCPALLKFFPEAPKDLFVKVIGSSIANLEA